MKNIINIDKIRQDFPILQEKINNKFLVYFDNTSTTQKPRSVISALENYYFHDNANVHRGVHKLAERATAAYENAREKVRTFINAKTTQEIIFVRGATEAINLVAQSYGRAKLKNGDEIIISALEHHSNIVPWQMICEQTGAILRVVNINDAGEIDLDHYQSILTDRTKFVAIAHASNVLGTINPIKKMISAAHALNVPVLIDGAAATSHSSIDVQDLDCDFYAFSGHKIYGPTGIGVLYGKAALLNTMPPYQGGGEMIKKVTFAKTEYADLPQKFEAGTPNIAGAIGLGAAIDYLIALGFENIMDHEQELLKSATTKLSAMKGLRIIGTAAEKVGIISFILDDIHPHDVATILDTEGIAVRAGHHCAMPLMERFQIPGTTRVSFGIYNTTAEIDVLMTAINKVLQFFK